MCIYKNNRAQILRNGTCPQNTLQAIAGRDTFIVNGKAVNFKLDKDKPLPRVAVTTNKEGNILWIIVVNGKQSVYSEGVTITK